MNALRKTISPRPRANAFFWAALLVSGVILSLPFPAESRTLGPELSAVCNLPLYFEADLNQNGQIESFTARGQSCSFAIRPTEATLTLVKYDAPMARLQGERGNPEGGRSKEARALRFEILHANPAAILKGMGQLPGKANYLLGNDASRWRTEVSLFQQARVQDIYAGVDLVYYGNQQWLEYDFVVAPKANPHKIAIRVIGADKTRLDHGDLVFTLGENEIRQPKPILHQTVNGLRKEIPGGYRLLDNQTFAFEIGAYNRDLPLVIDPVLSYSMFFGGTGADIGRDIAVDADGFVYIAGYTASAGLATPGAYRTTYSSVNDAFVAKFDNQGSNLVYVTYLGGKGEDVALALAVDADGNAYVTGMTTSTNFPISTPETTLQTSIQGKVNTIFGTYPLEAFITKLNTNGTQAIFSTYFGGSGDDEGIGLALDANGFVYLTGFTSSTNFPNTVTNLPTGAITSFTNYNGNYDAFVAKFDPYVTNVVYSMFLGGTGDDEGEGIAVDAAGNAYVTGFTSSTNFPVSLVAPQRYLNNPSPTATNHIMGAFDAFITKISPDGNTVLESTYLGGARDDIGFRLALDSANNVFVTGSALSLDFPVAPASNTNWLRSVTTANALADAFIAKLAPMGTSWDYSVAFGGARHDESWDVAVDTFGNAHLTGLTFSTNFPTTNVFSSLRATNSGGADAFLTVVASSGTSLVRSAFLGASGNDIGHAITLDNAGNEYLLGQTASAKFPTANTSRTNHSGKTDAFIVKISVEPTLSLARTGEQMALSWPAFASDFVLQSKTNAASSNVWTDVVAPAIMEAGRHTVLLGTTNEARLFRLHKP